MHLCNTKYISYRLVFVNAQHNVDLYIKLRLLIKKRQFSQQLTITGENNINKWNLESLVIEAKTGKV